ncbi:transcriptional regulator ArgP [Vibrio panuliri]|uniref:HTH-type transcriptional regulator ArgP n=1 Tax=Vibrio panuliri TaxID=1381081 RepID=A0A1Q9HLG4_9VIBR|nr:LysR family transcriptional regulator ArgP [Vibrio panuliri]OLQ91299.1 transcriptional regulator ArgP [Vibrio panuliri]
MRGLDYKWIEALDAIVQFGSFEHAAEQLYISQSAVSQRIKQLEKFLAQPALIREQPPKPTPIGKKLLGLYRRVRLLESELVPELRNDASFQPLQLSIATNADSLATWLLPALTQLLQRERVALNLVVDDEGRTLEKLKSGEVAGAISLESQSIPGCDADYLGRVDYLCVASPQFCQHYFPNGVNRESLLKAPTLAFDHHDDMNDRFIHQHFNLPKGSVLKHTVRSSEAFVKLALSGVAYCLIPKLQIEDELDNGSLVDITPGFFLSHRIYWHHWQLETGILKAMSDAIIAHSREILPS